MVADMPDAILTAVHAVSMPDTSGVPDWIHVLPAGTFRGHDGRGPYRADPAAVVAASKAGLPRMLVDTNHATDLAAPRGEPAPAVGWVTALQAREDGVWAQVDWTEAGRSLIGDRAYRFISPAIAHRKDGTVLSILRLSLTNEPNLRGLAALHHQEHTVDELLQELRGALGLPDTADRAAVVARAKDNAAAIATHAATVSKIALAAGVATEAGADAIVVAIQAARDPAKFVAADQVTALQQQLTTLQTDRAREKAEAAVDGAIKAGKPGIKPLRDHYIARHMADPAAVDRELAAMPSLHSGGLGGFDPPPANGELVGDEAKIVAMMGVDPVAYRKLRDAQEAGR